MSSEGPPARTLSARAPTSSAVEVIQIEFAEFINHWEYYRTDRVRCRRDPFPLVHLLGDFRCFLIWFAQQT